MNSNTITSTMKTMKRNAIASWLLFAVLGPLVAFAASAEENNRPNVLFCISDDQSYAHTGANGDPVVQTPAFDRIAREGLRFVHAFCDAPTCGPSRSAILTGQPIWRLEEAGNIHSTLPAKFATYTGLLENSGYAIGYTGKGWSPGRLEPGGRTVNPAGPEFAGRNLKPPFKGISHEDYAGNFDDFLAKAVDDQPFCFWLGTHEPHRGYEPGAGKRTGKDANKVVVPGIFPDNEIVRSDLPDYYIHNFEPTRWPSGSPDASVCARSIPYGEIDSSPTKALMEHLNEPEVVRLAELAFGLRPAEEFYDLNSDPEQLVNLAGSDETQAIQEKLRRQLFDHLEETKDPRVVGGSVDWDYYPYYGKISTKGWTVDPKPKTH